MAALPVPASTDPVADAAVHIGRLADAITVQLTSRAVAYWSGVVITNAGGDFYVPVSGVLSHCAGAIITDNAAGAHLYRFMAAGGPNVAWARIYTVAGVSVGTAAVDVAIIAFGTPA